MNTPEAKRFRILFRALLAVFLLSFLFTILVPSGKRLNESGEIMGNKLLLAQIRDFFSVPFCISSLAGLLFTMGCTGLSKKCPRNPAVSLGCRVAAIVMAAIGIFWCAGFVGFQVLPPMSIRMGMYIMRNRWIISLWWVAAALLLVSSAALSANEK